MSDGVDKSHLIYPQGHDFPESIYRVNPADADGEGRNQGAGRDGRQEKKRPADANGKGDEDTLTPRDNINLSPEAAHILKKRKTPQDAEPDNPDTPPTPPRIDVVA